MPSPCVDPQVRAHRASASDTESGLRCTDVRDVKDVRDEELTYFTLEPWGPMTSDYPDLAPLSQNLNPRVRS